MSNQSVQNFISLIQLSLGNDVSIPDGLNWKELYDASSKQAILGICFIGLQRIRQKRPDLNPPDALRLRWLAAAAQIRNNNELLIAHCRELQNELHSAGIRSSILKGQAIAQMYGCELSMFRSPGDIDIYVDCGRIEAFKYVQNNGMCDFQWDYKHLHLKRFQGIEVEMHYVPEILLNIRKNKKLQTWFKQHREDMFTEMDDLVAPSIQFNLFYILLHIYRHFLYEGIGLRQLMDYYFVLNSANGRYRAETLSVLSDFGMVRFVKGIMWIMKNIFLLDESCLLCAPDAKEGKYILHQVMIGGNFGHYDKRLGRSQSGKIGAVSRILKHNLHLLTHYPSDVIWAPIWFAYHWSWKRFWMYQHKSLLTE